VPEGVTTEDVSAQQDDIDRQDQGAQADPGSGTGGRAGRWRGGSGMPVSKAGASTQL
jgi:hypothetical protein